MEIEGKTYKLESLGRQIDTLADELLIRKLNARSRLASGIITERWAKGVGLARGSRATARPRSRTRGTTGIAARARATTRRTSADATGAGAALRTSRTAHLEQDRVC